MAWIDAHDTEGIKDFATDARAFILNEEEVAVVPVRVVGADPRRATRFGIGTQLNGAAERDAFGASFTQKDRKSMMRAAENRRRFAVFGPHHSVLP